MQFPETVPLLTNNDIVRGIFEDDFGRRRCLSGWCNYVFNGNASDTDDKGSAGKVRRIIKQVIRERYYPNRILNAISIVSFNDSTDIPHSVKAEVWNEAMRRLGYTEIQDA